MTEKQFIISQSLVSALLAYLQTRPYQEVAQAIPALMRLPEDKNENQVRLNEADGLDQE